jgi:hypothetical protein
MNDPEFNFTFPTIMRGLASFADDMREQDIHVGIGSPPKCVICDVWPCKGSKIRTVPQEVCAECHDDPPSGKRCLTCGRGSW